ncbi:hypothetical protein [Candidatus Electronema sp. JM]|uniref:hypothetical protein n=1 Tax=Candidatus Electronema sp. JM TaxID=3401571 RepID=UPI003AA96047
MRGLKYRMLLLCCAAATLTGCGKLGYKTAVDVAGPPSAAQISLQSKYYETVAAVSADSTKNVTALADAIGQPAEAREKMKESRQLRITGDGKNYDIVQPDNLDGYLSIKEKTEQVRLAAEAIKKVAEEGKMTVAVPEGLRTPSADPLDGWFPPSAVKPAPSDAP